jgi:hypothetical protein
LWPRTPDVLNSQFFVPVALGLLEFIGVMLCVDDFSKSLARMSHKLHRQHALALHVANRDAN